MALPTPRRAVPASLPPKKPLPAANAVATAPKAAAKGFFGRPALFMLLYGPAGVGKTSFAAQFPNPYFIYEEGDTGVNQLSAWGIVKQPVITPFQVDSWEETISALNRVALGHVNCNTLVVESLLGLVNFCFAQHCRDNFDNDFTEKGFYSYGKGPDSAARHLWPRFMGLLSKIHQRGINVIITGHSDVKTFNNPVGADYDRFIVNCDKKIWAQTFRACHAVLFYHHTVEVTAKQTALKGKAKQSSESRSIGCSPSASYDAKNQYGLPDLIEAGDDHETAFKNFTAAILRKR